jgi:hypothetical protein
MCSPESLYDGVCANCRLACPPGQFKRIPCTGGTSSDLVCANCTQNCPLGHYVAGICSGEGTKDTATCERCTCPGGQYARTNACTGATTSNALSCVACTNASSCPAGHYLSGTCSALTNTACTPCRSKCKSAEVEVQACSQGLNRKCLPDPSCFQDCPSGMYESRACSPPDTRQVCSACTQCPPGFYVRSPCSAKNDTQCARCTSTVCVDDRFNAQFGPIGGCRGNELNDTALCGVITESYGERCSANSYRYQGRVQMPHVFPTPLSPTVDDDDGGGGQQSRTIMAFDVHPSRTVYAYCAGNRIYTYDYGGIKLGTHLDSAFVPEHCSDIRFTSAGRYLMVTSRNSSRLFRCDPGCLTADAFVYSSVLRRYVCKVPSDAQRRWGDGIQEVHCIQWMGMQDDTREAELVQLQSPFLGGVQIFGSTASVENVVYTAGSFRGDATEVVSWARWASADASASPGIIYDFPAGVQIVGPPAYNERVRRMFVPVHDHAQGATKRLIIYQLALRSDGRLDTSKLSGTGVSVFFEQLYSSQPSQHRQQPRTVPFLPGFAVRLDTGKLAAVDEQEGRLHVLPCSSYQFGNAVSSCDTQRAPVVSTSYGQAAYKDLEFVGRVPYATSVLDPLTTPSKMFLVTLEDSASPRAELYVQCAKCLDNGITATETEALSREDCFCSPGFMVVSTPWRRGCERCRCKAGQYMDGGVATMCPTGREVSMPGCFPCSATCADGSFMQGSCDGLQTYNALTCAKCTMMLTAAAPPSATQACPAANRLAVRVTSQTTIQSASQFRADCTERRGLDCTRRQSLSYPFEGNDLLEDLSPFARDLVPESASSRSSGPAAEVVLGAGSYSSTLFFRAQTAARFNASNHEYYRIPLMANVFDPSLAVRVIPPGSRSLAASGDARRIQSSIVWEQGMTVCLWYKFSSLAGSWQTLFEMGNGYSTENVYIRRHDDTADLAFGVEHPASAIRSEHRTVNGTGIPLVNAWHHLCWTVRHTLQQQGQQGQAANSSTYLLPESMFVWSSLPTSFSAASSLVGAQAMSSYAARWTVYINGTAVSSINGVDGLMPVEGSYSTSFLGYGTAYQGSFFHGSMADFRMFERPLDASSVLAIYRGDPCCTVFTAGSYIDPSKQCTPQSTFDSEFCRSCRSDCGPMNFIENENSVCNGRRTGDFTQCTACSPCAQDQYMNRTCSGTSFADEATCPPCTYKTTQDCPAGKVMIGRCEGNQIYDTSTCIDCNAECVSAENDPQRRGQFIERECSSSSDDYVCKPCSPWCPKGTFVSSRCTGRGRTDTGCSICRSFCTEGRRGVAGAHGQFIAGLCDGTTTNDVQSCRDCRQCPPGFYPSSLCSGVGFEDTVTCTMCITSCPSGFYLQGNCAVEEVRCVPCDPPCQNQSSFLRETRACGGANGLNRKCEPTTTCKDAACPAGFYESSTCTDPEGPKFCAPCRSCSPGQYQSKLCSGSQDRECTDCTSECPDTVNYIGIVGECKTGYDTVDAVQCVPASWDAFFFSFGGRRAGAASPVDSSSSSSAASVVTTPATAGGACGENEWYVGTRTPMFPSAAMVQDTVGVSDSQSALLLPFKSDFSPRTMDTIVFLGVVGSSGGEDPRDTAVHVFTRAAASARHYHLATLRPWTNYYSRLDVRGSERSDPAVSSTYPMAGLTIWNAVDVMLSHDELSVYVFFSYTFDFIGKCSLSEALRVAGAGATNYSLPHTVQAGECSVLSPRAFPSATAPSSPFNDAGVTSTGFTLKGCTRLHPMPYIACLYDVQGSRPVLYGVDEVRQGGPKLMLDSYSQAYAFSGTPLGRPKSPPTWDPVSRRIYYIVDLPSFAGGGVSEMGLRYVAVNATWGSASQGGWALHGALRSGVLWRGSSSLSSNYHSLVYTLRSPQGGGAAVIMAACTPPSCLQNQSLVSFRGAFSLSSDRGAANFSLSGSVWDLGVRWYWSDDYDYGAAGASPPPLFVGQQLYMLSRLDKMWGMWTHCAPCPVNSFSPAGSFSGSGGDGIGACKCSYNYYGVLQRPVVDVCKGCRIRFEQDGVTFSPSSEGVSCSDGEFKTNVPCSPSNDDRTVDSTCAACYSSCR